MSRVTIGASMGLRYGLIGLLSALSVLSLSPSPADAKRKATPAATSAASDSRYADIVVDANSGDVLHSSNPDSLRYPASLTKIMTLYLLFEQIEAGKLKLDSELEVSANASQQAPSKLGLKPGQTITVEEAIKALVTKSANDIAVVIAEALADSEEDFAITMTRKARALGMTRTVYKNASGLPDDDQVTTARDQALLGLAVQDRFPKYYRYFSTPKFVYRGRALRNHNRLLGKVEGVDGIKTGYTRASGFNLLTSMSRGERRIVAAVFGGRTGAQRDARMQELIEKHIVEASVKRTAPKIAEKPQAPEPSRKIRIAAADPSQKITDLTRDEASPPRTVATTTRSEPMTTATIPSAGGVPAAGSTDPIKPHVVKTLAVKRGAAQMAAVAPLSLLSPYPVSSQSHATLGSAQAVKPGAEALLPPAPPGAAPGVLGVLPGRMAYAAEPAPAAPTLEAVRRSGWVIQIGAYDAESEAKQKLTAAQSKLAKVLNDADPFTEKFVKGEKTYYRARFAGFDQSEAEAACRQLKRNDFACIAIRN